MYESNEKSIDWKNILKRLLILVAILLVIFGIVTLITRCSKDDETDTDLKVDLKEQLDMMQEATMKYLTKENLPIELNSSKTIKLKYLINRDLMGEIKDDAGNVCDSNASYSEVTRLENNYALKISLTCGENSEYRIIYIGCFEECTDGGICIGNENSINGICTMESTEESTDSTSEVPTNSTNTNSSSRPSNNGAGSTISNNTNSNSSSTNNNSSSNNSSSNNTNSNSSTSGKRTLYQYEKCETEYFCSSGSLTSDNRCKVTRNKTYTGQVIKTGGETKTTYSCSSGTLSGTSCIIKTNATKKTNTTVVYLSSTSSAKNTATTKYTYLGYVSGKGYKFNKTTTSYVCSSGTLSGTSCVRTVAATKKTTTTPVTYKCADSSYTYNGFTNQCVKTVAVTSYEAPKISKYCKTTWSYSTSLVGWTRTGLTKLE